MNATQTSGKVGQASSTLVRVLCYENDALVARLMKEYSLTRDQAYALFKDTLRWLYFCSHAPKRGVSPPPWIDKGWHAFILFTMDYKKFCFKYFGRFIHHRPTRPVDPPNRYLTHEESTRLFRESLGELSKLWEYSPARSDCDCGDEGDSCGPGT